VKTTVEEGKLFRKKGPLSIKKDEGPTVLLQETSPVKAAEKGGEERKEAYKRREKGQLGKERISPVTAAREDGVKNPRYIMAIQEKSEEKLKVMGGGGEKGKQTPSSPRNLKRERRQPQGKKTQGRYCRERGGRREGSGRGAWGGRLGLRCGRGSRRKERPTLTPTGGGLNKGKGKTGGAVQPNLEEPNRGGADLKRKTPLKKREKRQKSYGNARKRGKRGRGKQGRKIIKPGHRIRTK